MSYAQLGLIEATDYNNIIGANVTSNPSTFHAIWSWGNGSRGYGQTPISNVAVGSTVTATQWATLINNINSANLHIRNTQSGLTANTAGQIIGYSGGLPSIITLLNQDRLLYSTNSAIVVNQNSLTSYSPWIVANTANTVTRSFGANVDFESADKARFFFNAGGRLKFNCSAVNNLGAASRSAAVSDLLGFVGGVTEFGSNTNGGRTGSGGSATVDTNQGYWTLTASNVNVAVVTSTTTNYTTDKVWVSVRTNGTQGQHNDNGTTLSFWATVGSTSGDNGAGGIYPFDDSIDVTPTVTVDVTFPETTNLSNTWGAVTVTRQGS